MNATLQNIIKECELETDNKKIEKRDNVRDKLCILK